MAREPLDPRLTAAPFTVGTAYDLGTRRGRLRGPDLTAPFRGVRSAQPAAGHVAYVPLLRAGERFSHLTAAELWGIPLPPDLRGQVHTAAPPGMSRAKGAGVAGHHAPSAAVVQRSGLPVSDAITTFLEIAGVVDLDTLIAAADHLIQDPRVLDPLDIRPHARRGELANAAHAYRGRGALRAREAVAAARNGVESPMETRLRLLLVRAGLPEPECGFEVRTARGRWIGWFDLAWREHRVIAEYDGDGHRVSTMQYERDIRRFDEATEAGWIVVRVRRRGVVDAQSETRARVERALRSRGWVR